MNKLWICQAWVTKTDYDAYGNQIPGKTVAAIGIGKIPGLYDIDYFVDFQGRQIKDIWTYDIDTRLGSHIFYESEIE